MRQTEQEAREVAQKLCKSGKRITAKDLADALNDWTEVRCLVLLLAMGREGQLERVHGVGVGPGALYVSPA